MNTRSTRSNRKKPAGTEAPIAEAPLVISSKIGTQISSNTTFNEDDVAANNLISTTNDDTAMPTLTKTDFSTTILVSKKYFPVSSIFADDGIEQAQFDVTLI
jgi:hypothetical protein